MSNNAELWVSDNESSIRIALTCFLREHNVIYNNDMTNEELRQLYIAYETGKL